MKCDKLLRGCRHDINMSVAKGRVATDQMMNNITVQAYCFYFYFLNIVLFVCLFVFL